MPPMVRNSPVFTNVGINGHCEPANNATIHSFTALRRSVITSLGFFINWEKSENEQDYLAKAASNETCNYRIMPLGGKSDWENGISNPNDRQIFTSCSSSSMEPNEEHEIERQQELKRALLTFNKACKAYNGEKNGQ
ncbi:hypothetical protein BCV72DRAFT_261463 [Rhizopus microsporus var. microsporus]|uniref:Uncharacterized protein n=1 Tax=Rhizopus microsporus var. microsporus TaxID=86635 RepID=A0A1X0R951_RHIZD|nr:hypothetical protein BCV72DRAFT_261463 [Rhizopus microsporus var. microsporus]